jgi:hypothetical protein
MEDNTQNSDEIINKAISDPEATIQSLDKAKDAIQQLMNTKKEVETSMQAGTQNESNDESPNLWREMDDTIDELMFRLTGGFTYYDLRWEERNKPKQDYTKYDIFDETGEKVETTDESGVIDYANTFYHYDMADNDSEEFKTFEDAKNALEQEGNFKVSNAVGPDPNQLKLFPDEKSEPAEAKQNTIISKMDPIEFENLIDRLGNKGWVVKKVVAFLKDGKQKEAYRELRRMLDVLKEEAEKIEESLVNSEIFRIIAESEKPKLNKADILDYIKKQKKS